MKKSANIRTIDKFRPSVIKLRSDMSFDFFFSNYLITTESTRDLKSLN